MRETGNIGAAYAATALAKIAGEPVTIGVTDARVIPVEDLPGSFGELSEMVAAVYMSQAGFDRTGHGNMLLAIFPVEGAQSLAANLGGKKAGDGAALDQSAQAAVSEMGAICACAYLNAVSRLIGRSLMPSPPCLAVDLLGAILQMPTILVGEHSSRALAVWTVMAAADGRKLGTMIFIPEPATQGLVLSALGVRKS